MKKPELAIVSGLMGGLIGTAAILSAVLGSHVFSSYAKVPPPAMSRPAAGDTAHAQEPGPGKGPGGLDANAIAPDPVVLAHLDLPLIPPGGPAGPVKPTAPVLNAFAGLTAKPPLVYPLFQEKILGLSVQKREITAAVWNEGPSRPMLVLTAVHGNERMAGAFGDEVLARWQAHPEELEGAYVILVVRPNPDGWELSTRQNADQVDLNRNFPDQWRPGRPGARYYGGPAAFSEPESRVLADLIETFHPSRIISVHQPLHNLNYDGPARELALAMAKCNHYPVVDNIGYPTPGSLGIFAGVTRQIPTITLELPGGADLAKIFDDNYAALLAALRFPLPPAPALAPAPAAGPAPTPPPAPVPAPPQGR